MSHRNQTGIELIPTHYFDQLSKISVKFLFSQSDLTNL